MTPGVNPDKAWENKVDALIWDGKQVPVIGGPVFAVLTGMFVAVIWKDKQELQPGLSFTSKKILQ